MRLSDDYIFAILDRRHGKRYVHGHLDRLVVTDPRIAVLEELQRRFGGSIWKDRWSIATPKGIEAVDEFRSCSPIHYAPVGLPK